MRIYALFLTSTKGVRAPIVPKTGTAGAKTALNAPIVPLLGTVSAPPGARHGDGLKPAKITPSGLEDAGVAVPDKL